MIICYQKKNRKCVVWNHLRSSTTWLPSRSAGHKKWCNGMPSGPRVETLSHEKKTQRSSSTASICASGWNYVKRYWKKNRWGTPNFNNIYIYIVIYYIYDYLQWNCRLRLWYEYLTKPSYICCSRMLQGMAQNSTRPMLASSVLAMLAIKGGY